MSRFMFRLLGFTMLLAMIASPMLARGVVAQDAATPCPPPTEEEATAFATTFAGAWNSGDADAVTALYTPDAIFHWAIGPDAEGSAEIGVSVAALLAAFPGIHVTIDRVWLAGDTIILRYIAIGVQETDFMGVPPSQATVTWTGINVMQMACGQIAEQWGEADHFGRIQQQGALPLGSPVAEATPTA